MHIGTSRTALFNWLYARGKGGKLKLRDSSDDRRSSGKITVSQALSSLEDQRVRSLASMRRQREKALKKAQGKATESEKVIREVVIPEAVEQGKFTRPDNNETFDDFRMVDQSVIFYTMLNSIKELSAKNKDLEARIIALENK